MIHSVQEDKTETKQEIVSVIKNNIKNLQI